LHAAVFCGEGVGAGQGGLFTLADGTQAGRIDAGRDQVVLDGLRAPLRELFVVLLGAGGVGMALHLHRLGVGQQADAFGQRVELLARLRAIGMGEYETLSGRDPLAAENRRVQFRGEVPPQ